MILTIGVAADANIVIFERIKEEARAGKSVRAAIAAGYAKGFHTIIDANVVTGDHGARPVRGRDRGRQGLRADAADRHHHLAGHGRRRDARDARAARRLPLVRQPALHGRRRRRSAAAGCRSTSRGRRRLWFAISGAFLVLAVVLARASAGSTSGSTSRAARRSRSRRRSRVAVDDVRAQADEDRPGRRRHPGPRHARRRDELQAVPDPDEARSSRPQATALQRDLTKAVSARELRRQERLVELRLADREARDPRDPRLARADHPLHRDPVRRQVRGAGDRRDAARRPDHGRASTR